MSELLDRLRSAIGSVYLGNPGAIDRLLTCLLARGHALVEDVPGVGKTLLASAVARAIDCSFSRVQLTPDLLPSDILGVSIFRREPAGNGAGGGGTASGGVFEFKPGPVFASIVLADEINRATPRTQTALLEAMNESSVTVDGVTHKLPRPFMLIATQNPTDFEGTYLLPENQLDRFLMRITLGYPTPAAEAEVLRLRPAQSALPAVKPVLHASDVLALQERADQVRLDQSLIEYVIAIATATREHEALQLGLSPRGSLALATAARATAVLDGRDYCIPEDIIDNVAGVCAHRIIPRLSHGSPGSLTRTSEKILAELVERVPSPA